MLSLNPNFLKIGSAVFITGIFIFFAAISVYALIPELQYGNTQGQAVTEEMLEKVVVENGILPKDADEAFLKSEIEKKNTLTAWIMASHNSKVSIIDSLREMHKKDGVIIRLSSSYYVDEINGVIYNSILKGDIDSVHRRGVGNIFKTIAIMEGDYDNAKDKVTVAREYMGEEIFQQYKEMYPEKYEKLIIK